MSSLAAAPAAAVTVKGKRGRRSQNVEVPASLLRANKACRDLHSELGTQLLKALKFSNLCVWKTS